MVFLQREDQILARDGNHYLRLRANRAHRVNGG